METQIRVPTLGESVTEATIAQWFKSVGDKVNIDEPVLVLETDKVTVEVTAPSAGTLVKISVDIGATVEPGALLATIDDARVNSAGPSASPAKPSPAQVSSDVMTFSHVTSPTPKLPTEQGIDGASGASVGSGSSKIGRTIGGDVTANTVQAPLADLPPLAKRSERPVPGDFPGGNAPREERVRMTIIRKRIAERLKEVQRTAAMLTTFNEVDMTSVIQAREQYRAPFEKKHGVKLGFMSFFVKASIVALKEWPAVNAEIDGDELVYKKHYDIGVAVGTPKGLVVPVVRDADLRSFAEVEKTINELGQRARDSKLAIGDLTGGTFTISNGGIYGSMMSTPILNPPQSGILGMHKIQRRPMVMPDDRIEPRPMMYLALSYDHRIIDGREAVSFLVRVKECIEDPQRILLDI